MGRDGSEQQSSYVGQLLGQIGGKARGGSPLCHQIADAGLRLDYAEIVDGETLAPVSQATPGARALVAAYVGNTRLIDNMALL